MSKKERQPLREDARLESDGAPDAPSVEDRAADRSAHLRGASAAIRSAETADTQTTDTGAPTASERIAETETTSEAPTADAQITETLASDEQTADVPSAGASQADPLWQQLYAFIQKTAKEQEAI